jgi:hypothetical protein
LCSSAIASFASIGVFGQAHSARLANPFQPCGDIDPVTHEVAVFLLDHIADMDADAILDSFFRRQASALGQTALYFDGAAHRVHYTSKLDDAAIPRFA